MRWKHRLRDLQQGKRGAQGAREGWRGRCSVCRFGLPAICAGGVDMAAWLAAPGRPLRSGNTRRMGCNPLTWLGSLFARDFVQAILCMPDKAGAVHGGAAAQ
ncbi:MAG: hypothetical protein L0H83_13555 [Salinisphaera sp.]|nr:hypothetical protein [Salinisphaera sp.]